jgi:SEC-C motif-containing protein
MNEQCPCGSGQSFAACCESFLTGVARPATPEQLMRSRYTAFCRQQVDYLIATHHPPQRELDERQALLKTTRETTWLSLRVLAAPPARGDHGVVEFVAFFLSHNTVNQLHERSNFVRDAGRWYYVDGLHLPPITVGRNDPCWCGSGRKLKQCHGR